MQSHNNMNNNHTLQSMQQTTVGSQPDYRTLLLMKRNSSRPPAWKSFEIADSDDTDGSDDDDLSFTDSQNEILTSQGILPDESASECDSVPARCNGDISSLSPDTYSLLKITIIEQKLTKCMQVNILDSVWAIKQRVIQSLAKKLQDPLNYGFFCKKTSSFLLEHKLVSFYVETKSVIDYELRYKRRVYHQVIRSIRDSRRLLKMQGEAKRRELMRCIRQQNLEKIRSLMKKGVDPNFHTQPSGNSPLTAVVNHPNSRENFDRFTLPAIKALIAGQAHLDFRNQHGFTPIHVAAQTGNLQVLEALLNLGAYSDSLDNHDLSPLYHCALSDVSTNCMRTLSEAGAAVDRTNSQGWTMLHQACRHGRLAHLEILLDIMQSFDKKEALLNAQNDSGNTALHMCAIYKEEKCLVTLLRHGVNSTIRNYSHQDASEVAVVALNVSLSNLIKDFPKLTEQEIAMLLHHCESDQLNFPPPPSTPPMRSPDVQFRRHTLTSAVMGKHFFNRTLQRKNPFTKEKSRSQLNKNENTSLTMPRQTNVDRLSIRPHSIVNTIALSKEKQDHAANEVGYFNTDSRTVLYIACEDFEASKPEEISLRKGEKVTVSSLESFGSIVPEGFCKVTCGSNTGLVPKTSIQSVKLRKPQATAEPIKANGIASSQNGDDIMMMKSDDNLRQTSNPAVFHRFRDVSLSRGEKGYGFILRGAKADQTVEDFSPTARQPGLQYLEAVEPGENAYRVGLRADDFVLKINGVDVSCMGHKQTVDLIRTIRDPIRLSVVSVIDHEEDRVSKNADNKSTTSSSNDVTSTSSKLSPSSSQINLSRSGSVRSALETMFSGGFEPIAVPTSEPLTSNSTGKLDSVLAMEEGSDENCDEARATLRRRPLSRRLLSKELQGVFSRPDGLDGSQNNREAHSPSSAASRRLIHVVAPKLPNASTDQDEVLINGTKSVPFGTATPPTSAMPSGSCVRGTSFHQDAQKSHNHVAGASGGSKKPPPPPQRRSSRLSNTIEDGQPNPAQATTPPVPRNSSSQSLGRGPACRGDLSGLAATVAMQAQQRRDRIHSGEKLQSITHNLVGKPPPSVAPKPPREKSDSPQKVSSNFENSKSAFEMALAAKQANMKNRRQAEPVFSAHGPLKAHPGAGPTYSPSKVALPNERTSMELPPPPPSTFGNSVPLTLPPPPASSGQISPMDHMILPPPPDDLISGSIPPPMEFTTYQKPKDSPTNTISNRFQGKYFDRSGHSALNGVDSLSNADSGVDEVALHSKSGDGKANIETLSVVSSLSTMSSEEGSDAGVSLSYDPKSTADQSTGNMYLDALKKKSAPIPEDNDSSNFVLRKVNFSSSKLSPLHTSANPAVTSHNPRDDVTKLPSSSKFPEASKGAADSASDRPLIKWDVDDVCRWLRGLGLDNYTQIFAENEIVGSHLPDLGKEDLLELGVTRVGHRMTIEKSLKKLLA